MIKIRTSLLVIVLLALFCSSIAVAQVTPPSRRHLFTSDLNRKILKKKKKEEIKLRRQEVEAAKSVPGGDLPFDINAPSLRFDSTKNAMRADGGVILTYSTAVVEADEGEIDLETYDAHFAGDVIVSDVGDRLSANDAHLNLKTKEARLRDAELYIESSNADYRVLAEEIRKSDTEVYEFDNTVVTTCHCPEGEDCMPWSLAAEKGTVEREGYGTLSDVTLRFSNVPVMYLPYAVFPVKSERQSGFLAPTIGGGSQNGFNLRLPFFWAINDSTDATITPIIETNTRYGVETEFRKEFSIGHSLRMGLTFLDESARDGDLQGTIVDGLYDPTIDQERTAAYMKYSLKGEVFGQSTQFIVDARYISDDLYLREFPVDELGDYNARYVPSQAVLRMAGPANHSIEIRGEYVQDLVNNDDFVLQRLPEFVIKGVNRFRPFENNPTGIKFVLSNNLTATRFDRDESTDGTRIDLFEKLQIPFHIQNYLNAQVQFDVHATKYELDEVMEVNPDDATDIRELPSDSDRIVPGVKLDAGTVLEKVFVVPEDSWLKTVAELGQLGRKEKLVRVKHTIEPKVSFRYVPDVDQDDTPLFDSIDRLAERNVATVELMQRVYARYEPRNEFVYGIEEVTPEISDLETLRSDGPLDEDFNFGVQQQSAGNFRQIRQGTKREIARLKLKQSFDILEHREDMDPDREPLSDLGMEFVLIPNEYVRLRTTSNYDVESQAFRSYGVETQAFDKRGDQIRTRLSFIDDNVRQLEGNLELVITDNLKLGYYTRYDDLNGEFLDNRVAVRVLSSCDCWMFDTIFENSANPDQSKVSFRLTLKGLGEIGNTLFRSNANS
jgi:LPS-assembly protein